MLPGLSASVTSLTVSADTKLDQRVLLHNPLPRQHEFSSQIECEGHSCAAAALASC